MSVNAQLLLLVFRWHNEAFGCWQIYCFICFWFFFHTFVMPISIDMHPTQALQDTGSNKVTNKGSNHYITCQNTIFITNKHTQASSYNQDHITFS